MKKEIVSFSNINYYMSNKHIVKNVSLDIFEDEILCFIGTHDTGKTIFSQIISGERRPTDGIISRNGKEINDYSAKKAETYGIFYITKDIFLINNMSIEENLNVIKPQKKIYYNRKKSQMETVLLLQKYGLNLNPSKKIAELSFFEKIRIEIVKLIEYKAKVIILDGISNQLNANEIQDLMAFVALIRKNHQRITFIYTTNRLDSFARATDWLYLWGKGYILNYLPKDSIQSEMIYKNLLKETHSLNKKNSIKGETSLFFSIRNLLLRDKLLDLELRRGEIVGILDIDNSSELFFRNILSDKTPFQLTMDGKILKTYQALLANGIQVLTRDYEWSEYFTSFGEIENLTINNIKKTCQSSLINKRIEKHLFHEIFRDDNPLEKNWRRKKIVITRKLLHKPKLLLIDNIIGSFALNRVTDFYNILISEINKGTSILLFFSDFSDVFDICDRFYIPDFKRKMYVEYSNCKDLNFQELMGILT